MGYYTQTEIDEWVNRGQHALAAVGLEIFEAEEVGEDPELLYRQAYNLWAVIRAYSTTNDFTDAENDELMSCLKRNGAGGYTYSALSVITSVYSASVTKGNTGATGATGPSGTRGSIITAAAGAPSVGGSELDNDTYINVTNGDVYTFSSGSWGSAVGNIKGATGLDGYGYDGTSATTYDLGSTGSITVTPNTDAGGTGLAYQAGTRVLLTDLSRADTYMVALVDTYNAATGAMTFDTNDVELLVLSGVEQSIPGSAGNGTSWTVSLTGVRGVTGSTGSTGSAGTRGSKWTNGAGAPTHLGTEIDGDIYLNTSNGDIYRNNGSTWGSAIDNITGPTGATGATGAAGAAATFNSVIAEHDTTGSDYAFTNSTAVITGLSCTALTDGTYYVVFTGTIMNTSTTSAGEMGLYLGGTLINDAGSTDTTLHPLKHIQSSAGDEVTNNVAITTIVENVNAGDAIDVRASYSTGGFSLKAGNLVIFKVN